MAGDDKGSVLVAIDRNWIDPRPGFYACSCTIKVGLGSKLTAVYEAIQRLMRSGVPPDARLYISGDEMYADWQETTR